MALDDQGLMDIEQRDSRNKLKTDKGKKKGGDCFTINIFLNGAVLYYAVSLSRQQ